VRNILFTPAAQFTNEENLPVFYVGLVHMQLLHIVADNQIYYFIDSMDDIVENPFTDFYVVGKKAVAWEPVPANFDEIKDSIDQSQYMIASDFDAGYDSDSATFRFSGVRVQKR
jgi:hypothetical protein